ncbi:MAG: hypothetical protein QW096_13105 [Thermofilaceae archaeon]
MVARQVRITYLLLFTLSFTLALTFLMYSFKLESIQYNVGNFDVLLLSQHPFISIVLMGFMCAILIVLSLSRRVSFKMIFSYYIAYLYVTFMGPYIANPPYYIHRDVFLHIPYSLIMTESGHLPAPSDRLDVISYPNSFILYAIYSLFTDISDPRQLGLAMALLYPIIMYISLLVFARVMIRELNDVVGADTARKSIVLVTLVLPFISRFAPAPGFPHRYHLAFVGTALLLYVVIRLVEANLPAYQGIICAALLFSFLVFTHPYFSFFTTTAIAAYLVLTTWRRSIEHRRLWQAVMLIALLFATHSLYLTSANILLETYNFVLRIPDRLMDFVETSVPVRVKAADQLIAMISTAVRQAWRTYISVAVFITSILYLYMIRKGVKLYALSLAIASMALIPILIASFLWWERSMTFVALTLLCAVGEILRADVKSSVKALKLFKRYILPSLFILSVVISPLIRWERPLLADNWQGCEKEVFLSTIALSTATSRVYIGAYSAVEYTYYRAYLYQSYAPNIATVFNPVKGALMKDVLELSGIYAVSVRDPDFELLQLEQILRSKSVVWNSGYSHIFTG